MIIIQMTFAAAHRVWTICRAADPSASLVEELPRELLQAAQLKVADKRFDGDGIRRLYESIEYPLARRAVSRERMRQVK